MKTAHLCVQTSGPIFAMIEVGEQLAWLGSACRVTASSNQQKFVRPKVQLRTSNEAQTETTFDISFVSEDTSDTPEDPGQCWRRLFRNICIAEGFPVNVRQGQEQGLEIPFEMMAILGGADRVTNYTG